MSPGAIRYVRDHPWLFISLDRYPWRGWRPAINH